MLITSICYGQKMLNEVKLRNSQIEEIDISSIVDLETYQKEKFENSVQLKRGSFSKLYKLKGSDDFLIVSPKTNKEFIENWDKKVLTTIEMYSHGINRNEFILKI